MNALLVGTVTLMVIMLVSGVTELAMILNDLRKGGYYERRTN